MTEEKKTIWVLEDDPECMEVYIDILGSKYQLKTFQTIAKLRDSLITESKHPDLLLSDLRLPDGNFLDFLTSTDERNIPNFPLIIVSSFDDEKMLQTAYQEGALDYLIKPFRKNEVLVKIGRHLNTHSRPSGLGYTLDHFMHGLTKGGKLVVGLTPKEQQIFVVLSDHEKEGVSKSDIVRIAWSGQVMYEKSFDVHLFNLRKKLREYTDLSIRQDSNGKYRIGLKDRMDQPGTKNS